MKESHARILLILTAAIWGFAFVAQRMGNEALDPMSFNALRFMLGALVMGALIMLRRSERIVLRRPGIVMGIVLFTASALQQIGLIWTSAGAAGFITGLYILFVPLLGLLRAQKVSKALLIAIILSIGGMALMNDFANFAVSMGNLLVLVGSMFWALHVQLTDKFRQSTGTLELAFGQYLIAALLSGIAAVLWLISRGDWTLQMANLRAGIVTAAIPILYGGLFSVGIAFSLQAFAQKRVKPTLAAIILCSEGLFALFGGWWLLGESITLQIALGAILMSAAMLLALKSD